MPSVISQAVRRYASSAAAAGGHSGGYMFWKRMSFFVAFPAIVLGMVNAYLGHDSEHPRPPFVKYDYMYRREKRFPWGDGNKSFFHNPHVNALPDGYEHDH